MIIPQSSSSGRRIQPERVVLVLLAVVLVLIVCAGVVDDASLGQRIETVRIWGFLVSGICAISIPHILFPERLLHLVQIANPRGPVLFRYQAWRLRWFACSLGVTYLIFAFYDTVAPLGDLPAKALLLLEGWLFLCGLLWFALQSYGVIGERSQQWAEGTKGGWYRTLNESMPLFLVPHGLVPSMLATGRITAIGAGAIIFCSKFGGDVALGWLAGLILMALAAVRLPGLLRRYDRHFYHTNAFYDEAFRTTGSAATGELRVLPYDATYWVPSRWRPNVWGSLMQLDRRLPMGRVMVPALLLLWGLHLRGLGEATIDTFLAIVLIAKNAALYLTITPGFAPPAFQAGMGRPMDWVAVRFCMNLKWTFPLVLALVIIVIFSEAHGLGYLLGWTGLDLLLALVSALTLTYLHEFQFRKQYS